ncbi:uncharacterized protein Z518_02437 [Rhinocladiella mackenziei CBS 650.93]|uniref:Actin-like ATPase domain-containing protein n=1 Tax=Rhinocladiella mackenziei CBS 650.93 TaxID=1442369 RepID=A0A0D2HBH4_9EURO|nr:uncharacterized protein Z518_02437 [Rhinocladiella mackenziei CBS 650.93]KIX07783.1 hypothetical protein Z518_02437 [Rhinocladiella mackenziei CBS 650.93]
MAKDRLVIAIDYGTTFTGVAFCHRDLGTLPVLQAIHLITDWPGQRLNATNEKVPSQIAYFDGGFEWGNRIRPRTRREAWTKLLLDEKETRKLAVDLLTGNNNDDGSPPPYPGKPPVEIAGDFLSGVKKHLEDSLKTRYGKIASLFERDIVITVPAVWSDRAKDLTCQAVSRAGFHDANTTISIITEPEAAAIYALKEMREGPFSHISVGDNFIVCDAGGGTVDLISYKVDSIAPAFKVTEAALWLKRKLGDKNFKKIKEDKLLAGSKLMTDFEFIKAAFCGDNLQFYISLPHEVGIVDDEELGIADQEVRLGPDDVQSIFDPCVHRVLTLIDGQINEVTSKGGKVKYVLLVGGFGMSDYLYRRIKDHCGKASIEAIRPTHPWSAVVRGALLQRLDTPSQNLVQVRLCRRYYGTSVLELFDKDRHSEADMFMYPNTNDIYAKGCMKWLLSKGDALPISKRKKAFINVSDIFRKDEPRISHATLWAYDGDNPPLREKDGPYKVCVLAADLSNVPEDKFEKAGKEGDEMAIVTFKIEITIEDSMFEFRILFDDQEYGSVRGEYV